MSPPFGSFSPHCSRSPLPECNLFFSLLWSHAPSFGNTTSSSIAIPALFPQAAARAIGVNASSSVDDLNVRDLVKRSGAGLGMNCEVWKVGTRKGFEVAVGRGGDKSLGDIAQIIVSSFSFFFMIYLIWRTSRRRAAVGRSEIRYFFVLYAASLPLQILTTTAVLEQGTTPLAVLSAIHVAVITSMFWVLLANGVVATQVVEDGTLSSLIPLTVLLLLFFGVTAYICLDTALGITSLFQPEIGNEGHLRNIAVFVLGLIWPAAATVGYLGIMLYVSYFMLREVKPCLWFILSFALFAVSQVIYFMASQPLCEASDSTLTSGFLATFLETAAVYVLFIAWRSITEDDWEDDPAWQRSDR